MDNVAVVNAICEIIKKNCADVVTVDLGQNNISSLDAWRRLTQDAPSVLNLSLQDNALSVCVCGMAPAARKTEASRHPHRGGCLSPAPPLVPRQSLAA